MFLKSSFLSTDIDRIDRSLGRNTPSPIRYRKKYIKGTRRLVADNHKRLSNGERKPIKIDGMIIPVIIENKQYKGYALKYRDSPYNLDGFTGLSLENIDKKKEDIKNFKFVFTKSSYYSHHYEFRIQNLDQTTYMSSHPVDKEIALMKNYAKHNKKVNESERMAISIVPNETSDVVFFYIMKNDKCLTPINLPSLPIEQNEDSEHPLRWLTCTGTQEQQWNASTVSEFQRDKKENDDVDPHQELVNRAIRLFSKLNKKGAIQGKVDNKNKKSAKKAGNDTKN